jgi:hypothetical protein
MANTVGETIAMDGKYMSQHSDENTWLISCTNELLQTCEAIYSNDDTKEK